MTLERQRLGRTAEQHVAGRLAVEGWRILERNPRTRYGELDIVAVEGATLVFVEVKAGRSNSRAGPERPVLSVGPAKQRRIRRLAAAYLSAQPRLPHFDQIRFDAIGVSFGRGDEITAYEHIENAF